MKLTEDKGSLGHWERIKLKVLLLTSCASSGRASRAFLALFSSRTGSRDLRNFAGCGERTLKGLELKN